jgi:non-ribosomal peptide synthetase component F
MTLLAAFAVLLARHSGQGEIVVGTPAASRPDARLKQLIGLFVNLLVLRVTMRSDWTFAQLLAATRTTTLGAYAHQEVPFEHVVQAVAPQRGLDASWLFHVVFAFHNTPSIIPQLPGIEIEALPHDTRRARYDIEVHAWEQDCELHVSWLYNRVLFAPWRIEQMAEHYGRVLQAVVDDPQRPVRRIDLLTDAERSQLAGGL